MGDIVEGTNIILKLENELDDMYQQIFTTPVKVKNKFPGNHVMNLLFESMHQHGDMKPVIPVQEPLGYADSIGGPNGAKGSPQDAKYKLNRVFSYTSTPNFVKRSIEVGTLTQEERALHFNQDRMNLADRVDFNDKTQPITSPVKPPKAKGDDKWDIGDDDDSSTPGHSPLENQTRTQTRTQTGAPTRIPSHSLEAKNPQRRGTDLGVYKGPRTLAQSKYVRDSGISDDQADSKESGTSWQIGRGSMDVEKKIEETKLKKEHLLKSQPVRSDSQEMRSDLAMKVIRQSGSGVGGMDLIASLLKAQGKEIKKIERKSK
jgi:hypothetical protein